MRIAYLGTGDFAVPALEALVAGGHDVVVAISQPDRPAGRGRQVQPTAVRAAAERLGVRHIPTADVNALPLSELGGAELGVVAAFGQKLGAGLLKELPRGCINIHGSLLPRYRGAAPFQWAIINGETETGVTIFQLDAAWDAGPIWASRATPIGDTETADELHDRLAQLGAALLVETLAGLAAGTLTPRPQDRALATRAPKLRKTDAQVDWTQPASRVARRINGLWSWPAATAVFAARDGRRERVLLARAGVVEEAGGADDAQPAGAFGDGGAVQCGSGSVRLLEVKPAGGRLMPFAAFANGRRVAAGDQLLPVDEL
jgi:methionyl-tRNA formyltransferase